MNKLVYCPTCGTDLVISGGGAGGKEKQHKEASSPAVAQTAESDERKAFEKWCIKEYGKIYHDGNGKYSYETALHWTGW